jgi:hypothetical protein
MSDLQDLTAAGNSSVIAGLTLSPPRLVDWAETEIEAAQQYLRNIARSSAEFPETVRQQMYVRAVDNLQAGPFAFGSAAFDAWALSAVALPFLLYLSLRVRQSQITRLRAAELLSGPDGQTIARAIWDLWGYHDAKKTPAPPGDSSSLLEIEAAAGGASLHD